MGSDRADGGSRLDKWVGVLALALYAALLAWNVGAVAGGADQSGYMNQARLLASGHLHVQPRTIEGLSLADTPPFLYVPLGFAPAPNGDGLVPTYPVGLPIMVLLLKSLVGWKHAGDAAIILSSIAGLAATYALGRMLGLGAGWAALGAAIVAASPVYLFMSLQTMSDVPSLLWTTAAVLAALKSRRCAPWALAAGGSIALDVLLRPTNVLAFIPVAVALGASRRRWILFLAGGLPGAVFSCLHSALAYGSPFETGYGDTSELFSAGFVPATLLHYARWIPALFTPVAVLFLGLPWLRGAAAPTRWLLGAWIAAFAAFYTTYQCTHEAWWYLRFLLPAAPAMAVGAMFVLRALLQGIQPLRRMGQSLVSLAAALALVAVNGLWWGRALNPLGAGKGELKYQQAADWMMKNVQPNAVCMAMQATGALFYYTDFTLIRWDVLDAGNVAGVEAAIRGSGRPLFAVLFPYEIAERHALETSMPGHWIQVGNVDDITVWRRKFDTTRLVLERSSTETGFAVDGPDELRWDLKDANPVEAVYGPQNWWLLETSGADYWRWSRGDCSVEIINPQPFTVLADVSFGMATVDPRTATVTAAGNVVWRAALKPAHDNQAGIAGIELPPGRTTLSFKSDRPAARFPGSSDPRPFTFSVRNLKITLKGRL